MSAIQLTTEQLREKLTLRQIKLNSILNGAVKNIISSAGLTDFLKVAQVGEFYTKRENKETGAVHDVQRRQIRLSGFTKFFATACMNAIQGKPSEALKREDGTYIGQDAEGNAFPVYYAPRTDRNGKEVLNADGTVQMIHYSSMPEEDLSVMLNKRISHSFDVVNEDKNYTPKVGEVVNAKFDMRTGKTSGITGLFCVEITAKVAEAEEISPESFFGVASANVPAEESTDVDPEAQEILKNAGLEG
jgi:hypothetical protein